MKGVAIFLQAMVWLSAGLYCKPQGRVPRHEAIVARMPGPGHAQLLTRAIGFPEILMSVWIASAIRLRLAVQLQIALALIRNALECSPARDLANGIAYNVGVLNFFSRRSRQADAASAGLIVAS